MLQNLLCLWKKKTHTFFFVFHLGLLLFSPYECPGLCRHRHRFWLGGRTQKSFIFGLIMILSVKAKPSTVKIIELNQLFDIRKESPHWKQQLLEVEMQQGAQKDNEYPTFLGLDFDYNQDPKFRQNFIKMNKNSQKFGKKFLQKVSSSFFSIFHLEKLSNQTIFLAQNILKE